MKTGLIGALGLAMGLLLSGCSEEHVVGERTDAGDGGPAKDAGGVEGCKAELLYVDPPWWHDVSRDPAGGHVGVGGAEAGGAMHLWRIDESLRVTDLGAFIGVTSGGWSVHRWNDVWALQGAAHVVLVGDDGTVLATRELGEAGVITGVQGVVPTSNGLLVLWADWTTGLHLDRLDRELKTIESREVGACCGLSMHGGDQGVFIAGRLVGLEGPIWIHQVNADLVVADAVELASKQWMSFPEADRWGNMLVAARESDGIHLYRFGTDGTRKSDIVLPGATEFVTIDVRGDEIVVYENPLEANPAPIHVWRLAANLSTVDGPVSMGSGVDVAMVEPYRGGWRALAYRHSMRSYGELWKFEGTSCE